MRAPQVLSSIARFGILALLCAVLACSASVQDRLAEVRAMQEVGEFRESIEPLRAILIEEPDHAEANYRLGLALSRSGQTNSALWPLQRAATDETYVVPAHIGLAGIYMRLQDFDRALEALDTVLARDPDNRQALSLRAKVNLEAKRQEATLADLERLLEVAPDDLEGLYTYAVALGELGRVDAAEAAHIRFLEAARESEQVGMDARACATLALHYRDYADDPKRGEAVMLDCLDEFPDDAFVVQQALAMYDQTDRRDKALELSRRFFDANPGDLSRRIALANRLRNQGQGAEAEALMKQGVEETGGRSERLALAQFYRSGGDAERALEAMEAVIAEVGGPHRDEGRFAYADALLDAERLEDAEAVIAKIDDPVYKRLLEGRVLLYREEFATALRVLEPAVEQWPDNPGARYNAGLAALHSGQTDAAVDHLREAVRSGAGETDAALVLARLYLDLGEPLEAARFAKNFLDRRDGSRPEAWVLRARGAAEAGESAIALEAVEALEENGHALEAAVERAHLARNQDGPAAALRAIERSGLDLTDPANEVALRFATEDLLELGRGAEAIARAEKAVRAHPDSAPLHATLGRVRLRVEDTAGAREAFERARELEADNATALAGLGTLEALAGESERAVELFDAAAKAVPDDSGPAYAAAQLVVATGQREEAMRRLRAIVSRHPGAAGANNDLAWLLADSGEDLDGALALAQRAARLAPQPAVLDTLGYVHLKRGEGKQAAEAFRRALEADPNAASVRYRLGLALAAQGDAQGASRAFEAALAAGAFPEADAARRELDRLAKPGADPS